MAKLFLLRHLKSKWNEENRFAGWTDGPLSKRGLGKARGLSKKIFRNKIDVIYTSPLFRNQGTVAKVLEYSRKYPLFIHKDPGKMKQWGNYTDLSNDDIPTYVTEAFNERYYGKLQGLNKKETIKKYGAEKVQLWRRSFDVRPPGGETLKDTYKRAVPFFIKNVEKDLKKGKNVLIVSSHNPLRALIKHIEGMSDKDILYVEVPFGGLMEYDFTKSLKMKKKRIV